MKLFQKPILVLLLFACCTSARAQLYTFSSYFDRDTIASFHLISTTSKKPDFKTATKLSCFVFLSPDCPLCKNYSSLINGLKQKYASDLTCYLIVPGNSYSMNEIKSFSKTYLKNAVLYKDANLELSHYLRATVTPEVVLLEMESGKAIYSGALDNWAVSLGKQRIKATENYLLDAIESYLHNQPATVVYKEPVGCLINDF